MIFGSVCSGIEAASVAWHELGWRAAWFSEIDPFASSVLAHRYPGVPNLGDMTAIAARIRDGSVEAPDVLVGGTPCQAFSVAGDRAGLLDPRGQLTLAYVDLADAIDSARAVRGQPACTTLWENVPGVLSSKDNAFGCFLGELVGEDCELQPPGGKWADAGCVFGPKRAVAWRVLDAQYFGLAQRRRRVFVVSSAREGFDPAAILFEFEGLRRDTAPSREAGEGVTHPVAPCLTSSGRGVERGGDTRGQDPVVAVAFQPGNLARGAGASPSTEVFPTLKADHGRGLSDQMPHVLCMAHGQGGAEIASERSPTLTCNHEAPIVVQPVAGTLQANGKAAGSATQQDAESGMLVVHGTQDPCISNDVAFALGRNNGGENIIALQDTSSRDKAQNGKGWSDDGTSYTLDAAATQGVAYPILEIGKRTGASTTDPRAGLGIGDDHDPMFTLQAGAQHGVAYAFDVKRDLAPHGSTAEREIAAPLTATDHKDPQCVYAFQPRIARNGRGDMGDLVSALTAQAGETGKGDGDAAPCVAVAFRACGQDGFSPSDISPPVLASNGGGSGAPSVMTAMAVRRLTPRECERLQGFPQVIKKCRITAFKDSSSTLCYFGQPSTTVRVVHHYLKSQNNAWHAAENGFPSSVKCAAQYSTADQVKSSEPVLVSVLIDLERRRLQILSQEKLLTSASIAGKNEWCLLPIQVEDFVRLTVALITWSEKKALDGKVESLLSTTHFTVPANGKRFVQPSGTETNAHANDVRKFIDDLKKCLKFITSEAEQSFQTCDLNYQTLFCFVVNVIYSFIQEQIQVDSSFVISIETTGGWTQVPVRGKPAADGPRYKALGNSMAVPVMRWIGRRISKYMERAL